MQYTHAIKAAMEGKEEGFSFLYNHTYKDKYYIALKYMGNDTDAQDVLQEAYTKAFQKLDSLDDHEKFPQWLGMIVANTAKNALQKKKPLTFSDITPENDEGEDIALEIEDEQTDYQPEVVYTQKETQDLVREMIGSLSDEQRMCILMFYMENQSIKEIAGTLGCSENTVKSRLNYGRKALKNRADDLESRGYKLRGAAPLPFLLGNLELEKAALDFSHLADFISPAIQAGGEAVRQVAGHTAAQGFIHTTAGKIAVGIVAAGLIGGGGFGIYNMVQPDTEEPQAQVQEETQAPEPVEEISLSEAYTGILDSIDSAVGYALYDLDGDGVQELLISEETDGKTYVTVYTSEKGDAGYEAVQIEEGFYFPYFEAGSIAPRIAEDGQGLYLCHLQSRTSGETTVERLTLNGNTLVTEDTGIVYNTFAEDGQAFNESNPALEWFDLTDRAPLDALE